MSAADGGFEALLGKPAAPWQVAHWINSKPLELADLRGRVVLLRFWAAPGCPFCSATAPALNELHERYAERGLTVLGFYHHKSRAPLDRADVERYAKLFQFRFPVAIDLDWKTLRTYWLDVPPSSDAAGSGAPRKFTSASFLIDRRGIVRYIHPGGQYVRGDADYARLEAMISRLCSEPN